MQKFKPLFSLILVVIVSSSILAFGFTLWQVHGQKLSMADDLERRTSLLADSFKESIRPSYINHTTSTAQVILDKFAGRERLLGLAIYDNKGNLFAKSVDLSPDLSANSTVPEKSMDADAVESDFLTLGNNEVYVLATPLRQDGRVIGALTVFQRANYIKEAITDIWKTNILRLFLQILVLSSFVVLILNVLIHGPILLWRRLSVGHEVEI